MSVDALLDKQEIHDVLVRFCRGVDRLDEAVLRSCFHDDALDDHGMFRGSADDFVDYVLASARTMIATVHSITNVSIELDGDRAGSEAYVTVVMRTARSAGGEADHLILARYIDRFERRDGGQWLIAERTVAYDLTRIDPVAGEWTLGDAFTRGARDTGDPSYHVLLSRHEQGENR